MAKDKTSVIFTGDIGFDRYMDRRWEDDNSGENPNVKLMKEQGQDDKEMI